MCHKLISVSKAYKGPVDESAIPARKSARSEGNTKCASTLPAPAD